MKDHRILSAGQSRPDAPQLLDWCVRRGAPLGLEGWVRAVVEALGLEATQRPRGRPRKSRDAPGAILSASWHLGALRGIILAIGIILTAVYFRRAYWT